MKLTRRATFRRTRRYRLRYRKPRFSHRTKPEGWLSPSTQHNRDRIFSWARTLTQLYPIARTRIATAKFDIQLMQNSEIQGEEYQYGTLYGWQLRAYVFHQNGNHCFYCEARDKGLTIDHIIPVSKEGTNRVANLTAACPACNTRKGNQLPEEFLADQPDKLQELLNPDPRQSYKDPGQMNTLMPFILEDLGTLEIPVQETNAALTAWNRRQLDLPKTHCHDAAILGDCHSLLGMPELLTHVKPSNGRRKQKAHIDRHGTPVGRPFRDYCRLGHRERSRTPTPGHAGKRTHSGPELIATGDTITIQHRTQGTITGRAVMLNHGKRVKIRTNDGFRSAPTSTARLVRRNPGYIRTLVEPKPEQQ